MPTGDLLVLRRLKVPRRATRGRAFLFSGLVEQSDDAGSARQAVWVGSMAVEPPMLTNILQPKGNFLQCWTMCVVRGPAKLLKKDFRCAMRDGKSDFGRSRRASMQIRDRNMRRGSPATSNGFSGLACRKNKRETTHPCILTHLHTADRAFESKAGLSWPLDARSARTWVPLVRCVRMKQQHPLAKSAGCQRFRWLR